MEQHQEKHQATHHTKTLVDDPTKAQEGGTQTTPGQLEEEQGHHGHAKPKYKIAAEGSLGTTEGKELMQEGTKPLQGHAAAPQEKVEETDPLQEDTQARPRRSNPR